MQAMLIQRHFQRSTKTLLDKVKHLHKLCPKLLFYQAFQTCDDYTEMKLIIHMYLMIKLMKINLKTEDILHHRSVCSHTTYRMPTYRMPSRTALGE